MTTRIFSKRTVLLQAMIALTMGACAAEVVPRGEGEVDDLEAHLSSNGSTVSATAFPAVVHYSVGCTATKIGDRKFLTAAHCVDDLAVGTTIRLTNHPQGLGGAPAADIKSVRVRSVHLRNYVGPDTDRNTEDDIAVFTIESEPGTPIPTLEVHTPFIGDRQPWFTQVGYGSDAIHPAESGTKQSAQFFPSWWSWWRDNSGMSEAAARNLWNRYLPAWTDDDETRAPGDSGGPALLSIDGRWRVIGVHSGPSSVTDVHFLARTSVHASWIASVGNFTPSPPSLTRESLGCSGRTAQYLISWSASGATRYDVDYKRGSGSYSSFYDGSVRTKNFSTSSTTSVTFRARACNAGGCSSFRTLSFTPTRCNGGVLL
ncbi:MAG: trypsin-like serine protease [Sandaracinus sp.]|nr:trypsin-like serine protease [Sandaracinus sp.]MCB9614056.1 trypsin-like serine protease [Sandaracinus sp.]